MHTFWTNITNIYLQFIFIHLPTAEIHNKIMDWISAWCKSKRRLDGVTAIVTGANTGIGKETARDFYLRGGRVILACRSVEKGQAAQKELTDDAAKDTKASEPTGTLIVAELDLSRLQSVREFAAKMLANEEKISILVNNAGVMMCPKGKTEDKFETHMGTNHFGHALLTLLLLPKIKESVPSRIVFVSSYLHQSYKLDLNDLNGETIKYDPLKAYTWSKAANVLFARALAYKLKEHNIEGITTYSLHPGVIRTEIGRNFSDTSFRGATWAFNNIMSWFVKSPRCGAQTSIYCAIDEDCDQQSGLYYAECRPISPSKQCGSDDVAAELWTKTLEALQLKDYDLFGDTGPSNVLNVK